MGAVEDPDDNSEDLLSNATIEWTCKDFTTGNDCQNIEGSTVVFDNTTLT